jgi:hypothetical protein
VSESKVRAASRAICSFEPQLKSRAFINRPIANSATSSYAKTADFGLWQGAALPKLCRFSDAGMTRLSTRCGDRRPKSANARSRGKLGTGWQRVLWGFNVCAVIPLAEPLGVADQPLFPNAHGGRLSAHGVHYLLAKHVAAATSACQSLKHKRVSPHVLRHTTAMDLLQQGVEQSVIALWLGHESIETTQVYLDANFELKQRVLDKVTPLNGTPGRYRPDDKLLAFLRSL